jgi:nucleotide-binding universal stress UspA family protein
MTLEIPSAASPLCPEYPTTSVLDQVWKEARTRAEEAVADARKTLCAKGLNVDDWKTPVGEPRAVILDEAKAWGANLIVLGSHGRHGLERMLMGSVAESVALHAHCSVEVVRQ